MTESSFMLGRTLAQAREMEAFIGGPVERFFALAQRCIWGVSQPDLVRVDVPRVLARLRAEYPTCMASHLLCAYALAETQPVQAAEAVERAQALCTPAHPWRYLLPTSWPPAPAEPELTEVIAGQLWRVDGFIPLAGTPLHIASTATLARTEGGALALVNPCPFSEQTLARIRDLGEVRWIVSQGKAHSRYVESSRERFAGAKALGTAGHLTHHAARQVRFDGLLDDADCDLPADLQRLPVVGMATEEVLLVHRPTGCLIQQDLVTHARANNTSRGFGGFLYYFAHGVVDRIGWASYQQLLWDDLPRLQSSLRAILEAPFARATGAHWPLAPVEGEDLATYRASLEWLAALTPARRRRLQLGFFARQPGFLVDLLRYKVEQKRLARQAS